MNKLSLATASKRFGCSFKQRWLFFKQRIKRMKRTFSSPSGNFSVNAVLGRHRIRRMLLITLDLLPGGELKVRCRRGIYYPFDIFDKFVVLIDIRKFNYLNRMGMHSRFRGKALPLLPHSSAVAATQHCHPSGTVLWPRRHSSLAPTAQFSDRSGRTVPLEQIRSSSRSFCVFDFTFFKPIHNVLVKPKMISLLVHFDFTFSSSVFTNMG